MLNQRCFLKYKNSCEDVEINKCSKASYYCAKNKLNRVPYINFSEVVG